MDPSNSAFNLKTPHGAPEDRAASSPDSVALQDPTAHRWMSRQLRAKGFRVISLKEPFAKPRSQSVSGNMQ
jgi:hypothetical protein